MDSNGIEIAGFKLSGVTRRRHREVQTEPVIILAPTASSPSPEASGVQSQTQDLQSSTMRSMTPGQERSSVSYSDYGAQVELGSDGAFMCICKGRYIPPRSPPPRDSAYPDIGPESSSQDYVVSKPAEAEDDSTSTSSASEEPEDGDD
ncbi:hypothetical protein VNI00_018475 [Paramarasmius palmivorus]|uniref:Uncharacterized protein n=1 Tax=Paramarasmius palmivorus TaxID=297713 RepID=A0AAW0AWT2_9AGAR